MSIRSLIICVFALIVASLANAQALEEVIDEDRYLRGLMELRLPEIIDRYLEMHPPEDAAGAVMQQQFLDRLALREPAISFADREAIISRMMARYDQLLEAHPNDPRRANWITDQAADVYFEWMLMDTSLWTALLGVPSSEQEVRIRQAADRMYDIAERAERIVVDAIFELEATPGFADDLALQSKRRRMVDEYRDRRVPFFRGIAMHLYARFNVRDAAERMNLAQAAAESLNEVIPRLEGHLQDEAMIHGAFARLLEGEAGRASDFFLRVRENADSSPLLRFAAAVGEARLAISRAGIEHTLQGLDRAAREIGVHDQLYYQLLLADQHNILRERPNAEAYRAYLDLIDAQPDEQRDSVRRIVLMRLAGHVQRFARLSDAPPIVQIAHAFARAFEASEVDEAVRQLELLTERAMSDRESALALLALARLYGEANRDESAAAALLQFARSYRQQPEAMSAVESALVHAVEAYRASPGTGRSLLREGLNLLFTEFPQSEAVDHWRLVAGRMALRESNFDAAINHFEHIHRESDHWREARFMQVEAARRAAQLAANAEQYAVQMLDLIASVERDLREENDEESSERLMLLHIYRAEAYLALSEAQQALQTLEDLDREDELSPSVIAEMLPIRIRALEAVGRAGLANAELDRLFGASPERAIDVLVPMIDAAERRVGLLIRQHRHEDALALAVRELLPLAERLEHWHDRYGSAEQKLSIGRRLADAYRYSGECDEAIEWYDELLADHPNAMPLLVGRAECLFALGGGANDPRLAEAMTIYRRVAAAGTEHGEDPFWLCQLRMLQILDRIERNTDRILPRIQQLRQRDPELGGEFFRRQFEQLQAKYTR